MLQRWFEVTPPRRSAAWERALTERCSALAFAERHLTPHGSAFSKGCGYSVIERCSDRQSGFSTATTTVSVAQQHGHLAEPSAISGHRMRSMRHFKLACDVSGRTLSVRHWWRAFRLIKRTEL